MSKRKLSIILLIFGVIGISFGGLIMRSISSGDPWQILFFRSLSFSTTFSVILLLKYKSKFINIVKMTGVYGFIGGIFYMTETGHVWDYWKTTFVAKASADGDGDGVADDVDKFPNDAGEWGDKDGDGVGDNIYQRKSM